MDGIIAYILSKKYTNDTVIGMGAIKGAACQVQSINKVNKTTTITLEWEDNLGNTHTQAFDIEDGANGVSVTNATITANGHLELTLSNGNNIDCGKVLPQYDTMPSADATTLGAIYQYIGATDANYTNGYFYECVYEGGSYKWVKKLVQDSYTKIEIGDLTQLPDSSVDVVQNIVNLQLAIDDLNASVLDKFAKKEDLFRYSVMPLASVDNLGVIVQFIGTTTADYINGYYYQCVLDGSTYKWVQKNIQPNSGSGGQGVVDGYYREADHLFYEEIAYTNPITGNSDTLYVSLDTNLVYRFDDPIFVRVDEVIGEDDVIDGYYNTTDHKFYEEPTYITEITGQTGKIYISDDTNIQYRWDGTQFVTISSTIAVDNHLDASSLNPVENRVITAKINDMDALIATKLSLADVDDILSGTSIRPVQNKVVKVELDKLSASMLSASLKDKLVNLEPIYLIGSGLNLDRNTGKLTATGIDIPIDDHLDASSINPVQNQVIALKVDQLEGSLLTKIQKKLTAQADNFAIFENDGDIKDSGISKDVVPNTVSVSNKLLVASDLSVKADKVSGATNDDIALLDGTGNLKDSNKKLSDYQEKLTDGNGINIDTSNNISLDITYLTASRVGYIPATEKGSNNGVAELDNAGKVPSSQLPSYVDDVIEGYKDNNNFYTDSAHTQLITPESGKIYVDLHTDTTWRWSGTTYVQISESLALGETSTTAYRGDRGTTAYDHSQITDGSNPHNTTADNVNLKVPIPALSGSKLDVESTLYGINTELGKKADKVSSATSGHLAGLDGNGNLTDSGVVANDVIQKVATATGLLKDDGTVDTTSYAPSANAYLVGDTAETTIDDTDYFPFYDTSATGKRKTLFSSIVNKLKATFATLVTGTFTAGNLVSLDSSGNIADSNISSNDIRKTTTLSNVTSSDVIFKISGFGLNTGSLFVIRARGGENILFALGNSSQDVAISYGYSAFRISGNSAYKINAMTYDYANNELYVNLGNYSILSIIQISGVTKYNLTITSVNSIPTTDIYEIPIQNLNSKIDKVSATQNDIAIFDANGGVADSNVLISSLPTIAPTPASGLTEKDVVDEVNSATATNANAPSLYGVQKYSNEKTVRRVLNGANIPSGTSMTATGIGTWFDGDISTIVPSTDEADWWYDAAFVVPVYYMLTSDTSIVTGKTYYTRSGSGTEQDPYVYTAVASPVVADIGTYYEQYSDDVDISIKFDPSGDTATLGGYIFDSTTGKICIKFGNSITVATARIAVDITYTRNEVG